MSFILTDYHTDKQILDREFDTEEEADKAKYVYLKQCIKDNVVHNNLILVKKIDDTQK